MTPIHYTTRVLPDGHLPLPKDFPAKAGEEVDVTLMPPPEVGPSDAERRADHLLHHWAGVGRGSGAGIAERHDDFLYDR